MDESQQYRNHNENASLAAIQQPALIVFVGDHRQTPGGDFKVVRPTYPKWNKPRRPHGQINCLADILLQVKKLRLRPNFQRKRARNSGAFPEVQRGNHINFTFDFYFPDAT